MSDRCFLDTNIFIYSLDRRDPRKAAAARDCIRQAAMQREGVISAQVVSEFFNVALRRLATPMTLEDADSYLAQVLMPMLVASPPHLLFADALRLHVSQLLAWYDALIVAAARQAECTILYSEDLQHGQRFGALRVVNPFL